MRRRNIRIYHRMNQLANILEKMVFSFINVCVYGVETLFIDAAFGKARFRKRYPYIRHVVHKTIVVRSVAPRVIVVNR